MPHFCATKAEPQIKVVMSISKTGINFDMRRILTKPGEKKNRDFAVLKRSVDDGGRELENLAERKRSDERPCKLQKVQSDIGAIRSQKFFGKGARILGNGLNRCGNEGNGVLRTWVPANCDGCRRRVFRCRENISDGFSADGSGFDGVGFGRDSGKCSLEIAERICADAFYAGFFANDAGKIIA